VLTGGEALEPDPDELADPDEDEPDELVEPEAGAPPVGALDSDEPDELEPDDSDEPDPPALDDPELGGEPSAVAGGGVVTPSLASVPAAAVPAQIRARPASTTGGV
jgi:hypothetical protein